MHAHAGSELTTRIHASPEAAAVELAREIVALARAKPDFVLGLASGSTPAALYRELQVLVRRGELDLSRAEAFALDEFLDLPPDHPGRFRSQLGAAFLAHAGIRPDRAHFPDVDARDLRAAAAEYEARIRAAGGIDLQLLGIGSNGHVAFNEPPSARDSRTRVVELDSATRRDAAATFGGLERVPRRALTMGVATICDARAVRVMSFGARKAAIVRRTLLDAQGPALPATWLRGHPDVRLDLDVAAAAELAPAARRS